MLFSTTTDVFVGLSSVASAAFNDFWPYLVMVIGIPLAFFIIEMLIDILAPKTGFFRGTPNEDTDKSGRYKDQSLGKNIYEVQNKGKTRFYTADHGGFPPK
jgi:hypothetical protein